ncbi:MAG: serine/threonine-protein kinase [Polyangiales bacterium]
MASTPKRTHASPELQWVAGRYEIERPLGRGGAAQVSCVRDRAEGTRVALKLLHADASRTTAALFELEYRTLASIQHPCVVRALDFGRAASGATFYTMELLAGEELKERAPVPWREACAQLRDAARALALVHARGMVHRDVSPRNLFRTPDGRVKLIDFGSLAPFGRSDHVVGTPPFLAPEALWGQELDPRTDLYALGAVAYFLLTRVHAYPAHDLRELPELWKRPPPPPSQGVAQLGRDDLGEVPPALDALVLALLSPHVLARPASAAEVIDRIDALVGGSHDADSARTQHELVSAHLASAAYVGRDRVQRTLSRQLALAHAGRGRTTWLEGEPGSGRSRALRELAIAAPVTQATVLRARGSGPERDYDVASALALQLLRLVPEPALAAARPFADTLAPLSPALAAALAAALGHTADVHAEPPRDQRVRLQRALCEWFLAVADAHTLVVLIDDVERADEGSQAFLLALSEASARRRLLLVCTASAESRGITAAARALHGRARLLRLERLDGNETRALLRSIFGDAEHLPRLAARLAQASGGNPGHLLELCAQMLADGLIRYVDGGWVLPQDPPHALLSASRAQVAREREARLDPSSRALARVLSVEASPLPLALAQALADVAGPEAFGALPALLEAGVCAHEDGVVFFVQDEVRKRLRDQLEVGLVARAHRVVGTYRLAYARSELERLQAGVHLLESGDTTGEGLVARAALHIALHDPDTSKPAAPAAARALALLRAAARRERELSGLLGLLALAGYAADARYAAQYGPAAVAAVRDLVGLTRAERLRPWLGAKGALLVGLFVAAVQLGLRRQKPQYPSHKDAVALLFGIVAALTASSAVCLDPERARAHAEALAPFRALGAGHIASFMYDYCVAVSDTPRDRHAHTRLRWQALIARLSDPALTRALSDSLTKRLWYGALSALGVIEAQRDDPEALALAGRSEQAGLVITRISAAQIRAVYQANQGHLALFEQHGAEAEQLAIQQGTSWQAETWAASTRSIIGFRMHDALMLRQVADHAERLSRDMPSLTRVACRARGAYLVRRGRHAEAIAWLEDALGGEPREYVAWTRTHGILAHALNALGKHERALAVCTRVFAHSSALDLAFGGADLLVQAERLVAEAALGDAAGALTRLDALRHAHPEAGPLTRAELHDAAITIGQLADDDEAANAHLDELERLYVATGAPSLVQYAAARRRALMRRGPLAPAPRLSMPGVEISGVADDRSLDTIEAALAGSRLSLTERAQRALHMLVAHASAQSGHLFLRDADGALRVLASHGDEAPAAEVLAWARARLDAELEDEATQLVERAPAAVEDGNTLAVGTRYYRYAVLAHGRPVGCVVLGSDTQVPPWSPAAVLRAIARHLSESGAQEPTSLPPPPA